MPKRPRPFLIFRKFETLKLCFKVGIWGTKRSVLAPWARNSTYWSSQMHEFCPNGENVEICEIWWKTIFWKNCSTLGLWGTKRSVLSPWAQKTYSKPLQIGRHTETATPFFWFFEYLTFWSFVKIGIWKRRVLLSSENTFNRPWYVICLRIEKKNL